MSNVQGCLYGAWTAAPDKLRPVHVEDMFSAYNERRTADITDNLGK